MKNEEDEYEKMKKNLQPKDVPLPCGFVIDVDVSYKKRKQDVQSNPIMKCYDVDARTQLDQEIGRMYFTGGLSFNLARNPHYLRSYAFAASHNLPGYVPPGYNKLRTTLLQQEKANVERLLQPLKGTWPEKGLTICTDG
ncbi:unnamed protein product [Cuscuta campestris]|uniref:DUF659 domain-containing protein n=1 Tax=Cuscuta campestris TaxID=132261 RepID=A0A484L4T8_9ASTE|nr:unnamed protein product [Cuscuta campestris]